MARVYIEHHKVQAILKKYKIKLTRSGYYDYDSRRIYERIDGKFVSIGWHIFNNRYSHETYSIVVLDSEM